MKIVFVGDSLVSCTNVALAATWPEIAAKKLGFTAVNHAAGGRLTILMRGMFCSDALAEAPDGVFIQCGINDVLLDEPLEKMKENICVTLDTAKEGGIPLIMLGSPILARPESTEKGWQLPSEFAKHDAALKAYRQFLKQEAARRDLLSLIWRPYLKQSKKKPVKISLLMVSIQMKKDMPRLPMRLWTFSVLLWEIVYEP